MILVQHPVFVTNSRVCSYFILAGTESTLVVVFCVGFAAESENLETLASAKRISKNVPLLVANIGPQTFGLDENALLLVDESGIRQLPWASKDELSAELVKEIASRMTQ